MEPTHETGILFSDFTRVEVQGIGILPLFTSTVRIECPGHLCLNGYHHHHGLNLDHDNNDNTE